MPRAGDAFLAGALPLTNNPLDRINFDPFTSVFDIEAFIQQLEKFVTDYLIPIIKDLTGIDLSFLKQLFEGIDLTTPGGIVAAFSAVGSNLVQLIIDALVNGLTGGNTTGNDPVAVVIALAQQGLAIPLGIFDQLWASVAQLLSGQQALQNSPGTSMIDDFLSLGVSGYTDITGTLALSSVGPYVQTPSLAVAYRDTGPSTDQHGAQIVIQGNQQGWCGAGICSDTSASSYALLQVYSGFEGDAVRLLTGSAPDVAAVQAQTDFITPRLADTNTFDIWYETATNTFHVLRNGQKVFDWPDTSNIVTHDASHRKVLLFSNGEDDSTNGSYGPGIRKFTAYDRA